MKLPMVRLNPSSLLTPKVQLPGAGIVMVAVASITKLSWSTPMVRPGKVWSLP